MREKNFVCKKVLKYAEGFADLLPARPELKKEKTWIKKHW